MKHILILGASSDIATATAHEFARNGFGIQLAGRNLENLKVLQKDIMTRFELPVSIHFFEAEDFSSHQVFWDKLPQRPDVCLCAFGYLGSQERGQKEWEESKRIIQVNYTGAVSILNVIANAYEAQSYGAIIGISSVAGERGRQSNYLYGSAKAGFTAYLSGLRNRLFKKGVPVLTVKPGFVRTRMTDGLDLPNALTAEPRHVGKAIYKAYRAKEDVLYALPIWRIIMQNIRLIPENIFKKMNL